MKAIEALDVISESMNSEESKHTNDECKANGNAQMQPRTRIDAQSSIPKFVFCFRIAETLSIREFQFVCQMCKEWFDTHSESASRVLSLLKEWDSMNVCKRDVSLAMNVILGLKPANKIAIVRILRRIVSNIIESPLEMKYLRLNYSKIDRKFSSHNATCDVLFKVRLQLSVSIVA